MKIIDVHTHLPIGPGGEDARTHAKKYGIDCSLKGYLAELDAAGVSKAVLMSWPARPNEDALIEYDHVRKHVDMNARLIPVCAINPYNYKRKQLFELETALKNKKLAGIKIFLGYYPFFAGDDVYAPAFELAAEYKVPVILHTGDTFGSGSRLKFAHPLQMDDVAGDFPRTTFVLAHLGSPWIIDATAVVYKNENVFADLSGLVTGRNFSQYTDDRLKRELSDAIDYLGTGEKLMFGTDWPFVNMKYYQYLIMRAVPEMYHQEVFHDNAVRVFGIKE